METFNKLGAIKYLTDSVEVDTSEMSKSRMCNIIIKVVRSNETEFHKSYLDSLLHEVYSR